MTKSKQKVEEEYPDVPAIPPVDYKGTQACWMITLQEKGLWDGDGWYGDVEITNAEWWEVLEECEGTDDK